MEGGGAAPRRGRRQKPGKWFNDALEGALFAHEEAAKALPAVAPPQTGKKKRVPFAPEREKLVEAYQRYVRWAPGGKLASKAAFRAAKLYYDHFVYGEAIDLFTKVALDHPEGGESEYAANLVLDAYNELGDWRNLNGWAKRFYANAPLLAAHPKLRDDLPGSSRESTSRSSRSRSGPRTGRRAAESYLSFVRDWPGTAPGPDRPLQRLGRLRPGPPGRAGHGDPRAAPAAVPGRSARAARASTTTPRGSRRWPTSRGPPTLRALLPGLAPAQGPGRTPAARGAPRRPRRQGARRAARPSRGARTGGLYEEKRANDAIINAAVFRAGLREWAKAEAASQAYLDTWPDGADAPRIALSLADLAASAEQPDQGAGAAGGLPAALRQGTRRLAGGPAPHRRGSWRRAATRAAARRPTSRGSTDWRRERGQVKERGMPVVAEALFRDLEPAFAEYRRIDLNVGQKFLQGQLQMKGAKLKKLEEHYSAVVKLGGPTRRSARWSGLAWLYENFAQVLLDAPVPREVRARPALLEEYQAQLAEQAEPLEAQGAGGAGARP